MKFLIQHFRIYIFWLMTFAIGRIYFLIFTYNLWSEESIWEMILSFKSAIYLDTSIAGGYFMIISFIFININLWVGYKKWIKYIHTIYIMIFLIGTVFLLLVEPPLFMEWKIKPNAKALSHLTSNPLEVIRISPTYVTILFIIISSIWIFFSYKFISKYVLSIKGTVRHNWYIRILYFILMPGIILASIRGGVNPIPISQTDVYYSRNETLNLASVNSVWNIGQSYLIKSISKHKNIFTYEVDEKEAIERVNKLLEEPKGERIQVLNNNKPNVLFIIMESWSSDFVERLDGFKGIVPNFNKLTEEGLLFTKCVGNGPLSDKGIASIFSSFPAQPGFSIVNERSKYRKLPFLGRSFKNKGYNTSFIFGGDLAYGNIGAYLESSGIDNLIQEKDLKKMDLDIDPKLIGKLGYQDEVTFNYLYNDLKNREEPFFANIFSLSTHSPYDFPKEGIPKYNFKTDNMYMSGGYYADVHLGEFIKNIKKEEWYKNTLVVIVADHSHGTPNQYSGASWKGHHIPMLWLGGALKNEYRGKTYDNYTNQENISKTIFNQLGWEDEAKKYKWSRDMFNSKYKNFAYLSFNSGYTFKITEGEYGYNYRTKGGATNNWKKGTTEELKNETKRNSLSFLRILFQNYLDIDNIK